MVSGQWTDGYRNNLGTRARGLGPRKEASGADKIENLKLKVENVRLKTDTENKTASVSVGLPLGEGGPRSGG